MGTVWWVAGAALLLLPAAAEAGMACYTRARCFEDLAAVPPCDYALVLGTAKYVAGGGLNRYYRHRIEAAAALWQAGKVGTLVVSGSGLTETLSETVCMQADLAALGVPAAAIWQDPAGLRTLDSVLRYRAAFGGASVCVVSQPFHNRRALVLARACGAAAVAYQARAVGIRGGWRVQLRERFARLRLWYDVLARTPARYSLDEVPIRQYPGGSE
ncbi:MAG: ElyC/SanA/YdcF family protein [Eikenella sp.]|nr:ElyC/SanA/YdcF family protein [Eikenella sp.]